MTNAAAIGYMILAAQRVEVDEETIREIASAMYYEMDETTESEAEKANQKF